MGVDIDNALIDQCRTTVEQAFSLQKPLDFDPAERQSCPNPIGEVAESSIREPSRKKRKLKNGAAQDAQTAPAPTLTPKVDTQYFHSFFPQLFGPIDIHGATLLANSLRTGQFERGIDAESRQPSGHSHFPRNLEFHAADWASTSIDTDKDGYDVILG